MSDIQFDPNGVGIANGNYFGFPNSFENAQIVFLPVTWDVTTSYGGGTANGPQAILDASLQLDFHDYDVPNAWKYAHATLPISEVMSEKSEKFRGKARSLIDALEHGSKIHGERLAEVNRACEWLQLEVEAQTLALLKEGKFVGLVGGDHSSPLGYMKALASIHESFGVLQIDAHADLREAYEGFIYSHASIMYNALKIPQITKLVQVGVRDICPEELALAKADKRIQQFDDYGLKHNAFAGMTWKDQCNIIADALPPLVYISFDIDGLKPELCPNTGTPVAGGLDFHQASFLIKTIVEKGKRIIGFDLNEVSPGENEWDANVGARVLYKLRNLLLSSNTIV